VPLWPGYKKGLKSQIADMRNVGGRDGGACVAAVFLKEFVSMKRWAHLDIAGVDHANDSQYYINKGMTGESVMEIAR
jgi:leucyl aminopeptidase